MKQNNYSFLKCKLRSWWLLVLLMLFMGSGVAQAVDYVTLTPSSTTVVSTSAAAGS